MSIDDVGFDDLSQILLDRSQKIVHEHETTVVALSVTQLRAELFVLLARIVEARKVNRDASSGPATAVVSLCFILDGSYDFYYLTDDSSRVDDGRRVLPRGDCEIVGSLKIEEWYVSFDRSDKEVIETRTTLFLKQMS